MPGAAVTIGRRRLGKLVSSGDRTKVPQAFYGMHNELADMTA